MRHCASQGFTSSACHARVFQVDPAQARQGFQARDRVIPDSLGAMKIKLLRLGKGHELLQPSRRNLRAAQIELTEFTKSSDRINPQIRDADRP